MSKKNKMPLMVMIALTAVMAALNVILERFLAIQTQSNQYSLSIITLVFAAVYLGLPYTVCVAALGDILGALIAPTGPYFPGFTLTNIIFALSLWFFLRNRVNIVNTVLSVAVNKIVGTLILNSIWIAILYKGGIDAFPAYMVTRIPQAVIMGAIDIVLILAVFADKSPVRKGLDRAVQKV